jgi:hypothetical protein
MHGLTGASALTGACNTLRCSVGLPAWGQAIAGATCLIMVLLWQHGWLCMLALLTYASRMSAYAVKQVPIPGFNLHSLAGELASVLGLDGA